MRRSWCLWVLVAWCCFSASASAATGKIVKVLPEFLDKQGRTSLSPSLYERDAYQALLRAHPERRSGLRFYVEWKTGGALWEPLKLRLELRGTARGNLPQELVLEEPVENKHTAFTRWTWTTLTHEQYQQLGAVTAWRVTLWEGKKLLGQQQSFLW